MSRRVAFRIWGAALALLLAALWGLAYWVGPGGGEQLLLVTPKVLGALLIGAEELDECSKDTFLLTYASRRAVEAKAIHSGGRAVLVGTNQNYAALLRYATLDGAFFTKAAVANGEKHMTVNATAAFQLFGSIRVSGQSVKIDGQSWLVTGVIEAKDEENANLYAPATLIGNQLDCVIAAMDDSVSEAVIKNALKTKGLHETGYDFLNLSQTATSFGERFAVAWQAALLAAIGFLSLVVGKKVVEKLRFYQAKMVEMYARELGKRYRKGLLKLAGAGVAIAVGVGGALALALHILQILLTWNERAPLRAELATGVLGPKLRWLLDWQLAGEILFGTFMALLALGLGYALWTRVALRAQKRLDPGGRQQSNGADG